MKTTNALRAPLLRTLLITVLALLCAGSGYAQVELLRPQKLGIWGIPPGNYSGITPLGNSRYAVISDKQDADGFYEFRIVQNETTGRVEKTELIAFHAGGLPARDAEGIAVFPDSATVFISAEDDQMIAEYTLDGQRTGRSLAVPEAFSVDSIYPNYGFEALGYSGKSGLFWTCTENSLRADGPLPTPANPVTARLRLQSFDKNLMPARQFVYQTDAPEPGKRHRRIIAGVPGILALDNGKLLILEREVLTTKNNIGNRVDCRLYLFSPEDSVKTLQTKWSTRLNLTRKDIANYEGMCPGIRLRDGRQTILLLSDAQNGAGNALFRLQDYIRVGILGDSSLTVETPELSGETAFDIPRDTAVYIPKIERILSGRWVQTAYTGGALIAAGLLVKSHTRHFRSLRNDFTPHYRASVDDYLQYSPMVVSYLLTFAGVKGRSMFPKRITSNVISLVAVNLVSNGLKNITGVERPDGSNKHSMPSVHTAGAFMAATLLYKEYGDYGPWVGYSAYTVATATGVMRIMRDKHWLSDVLVGAGIGIIGAEFGSWLSDFIFPSQRKSWERESAVVLSDDKKPHFIGSYAGFYVPLKRYRMGQNRGLRSANGATMGVEGAYFITRHVGFGGQISLSDISYNDAGGSLTDYTSRFLSYKAGCFFACPLHPRVALGAKLLCGLTRFPGNKSNLTDGKSTAGACALAGLNISLRPKQHLAFRAGIDYEVLPSPSSEHAALHALLLSGSAAIRF
ncbi:MAG: esterase-like activity of phytase family protein [Prevotella sp.]|nr:esterase-like activity of phytase family protein [Prevotella sp.]